LYNWPDDDLYTRSEIVTRQ